MSLPVVVLCIDDHPDLLKIRKNMLEKCGYSVETASSVATAIKKLENGQIAAVVVDYKAEGMDAQAVAYHIKQRFPNEPIILFSAYSCMPESILWLVDEYVLRSEPLERLVQVIERVTATSMKKAPESMNALRYRAETA